MRPSITSPFRTATPEKRNEATPAEIAECPRSHSAMTPPVKAQWNTAEDCDCIARRPICGVEQPKDEQQRNRNNHAQAPARGK